MAAWAATQAKAKFSEVLDRAESEGPQLVLRRKQEFFVLTREQRDALTHQPIHMKAAKKRAAKSADKPVGTLGEFFRNSPLVGSDIRIRRISLQPRHIDF